MDPAVDTLHVYPLFTNTRGSSLVVGAHRGSMLSQAFLWASKTVLLQSCASYDLQGPSLFTGGVLSYRQSIMLSHYLQA